MRKELRPAQIRRVYREQGESVERLMIRYLADRLGGST